MRRPLVLISAAWLIHATAWLLPTITGVYGASLDSFPGWLAFVLAAASLRPGGDTVLDTWYQLVLAVVSVSGTVFFVVGSPWVVFRGRRYLQRVSAWAVASTFIATSGWIAFLGSELPVSDLGIGYYFWWLSFLLLAIGLLDLARSEDRLERPLDLPSHGFRAV